MRVCFLPHVDPRDRLPGAVEEKCDGLVQFVLQHPTLMESFLAWLAMASGSTLGTPQWRYPPISITLSPLEKQHQGAIQRMAHDLWRACRETAGPDQSARDIWDRCRGRMLEVMVCDIVTKKRASGSDRVFGQSRVLVNGKSVSVGPRDSIDVGAMSRKGCATDVAAYECKVSSDGFTNTPNQCAYLDELWRAFDRAREHGDTHCVVAVTADSYDTATFTLRETRHLFMLWGAEQLTAEAS